MIISDKFIRNIKTTVYSLPMNLHEHQWYCKNTASQLKFGQQILEG